MMWCFGERPNAAQQRYVRGGLGVALAYVGLFFGSAVLVRHFHPQGWRLYLAALLPCGPIVGLLYIVGRYLREEKDEFQRDMVVRCLLWGIAAVLTVEMFSSFLRIFGWTGSLPPFTTYFVLCGTMVVAKFTYKYRNRVALDDE